MDEPSYEAIKAQALRELAAALDDAHRERRWGVVGIRIELQDGVPKIRRVTAEITRR